LKVEQNINFKQSGLTQASNAPLNSILISLLCLKFKSSKIAKMLAMEERDIQTEIVTNVEGI